MVLKFVSFSYSMSDVPGKYSLILFLSGCNFKCKHCINWRIVLEREKSSLSEEDVLEEIRGNPVIECLVLSGGEPTVHKIHEVINFLEKVRKINNRLKIRIDTNGYNPEAVKELKKYIDGFAVDIKAPLDDKKIYSYTTGINLEPERIIESVNLVDGMPLTLFRTVKYPWLSNQSLKRIEDFTRKLKSPWFLNPFYEVPDCPFNG